MTEPFSSTDLALARRIEDGHAHAAIASTRELVTEEIAGGSAIFHHPDSPVTQAIGIGMRGAVTPAELDRLEAFYHSRGSAAVIDLCTLADPSVLALTLERRYAIREISHVLARRLNPDENFGAAATDVTVEPVQAGAYPDWARLVLAGFSERDDVSEEQVAIFASRPWAEAIFGQCDGARCAGAAMDVHAGLATLVGDATLLRARRRGLQLALIRHRLQRAAQLGCDLATASVVPASVSHRNYERAGFRLVYARVMLGRGG